MAKLSLIVIKSPDTEKAKSFYEMLGLRFQREQHGNGPLHYSCVLEGIVFEIYPLRNSENPDNIRLGFKVDNLGDIMALLEFSGAIILQKPTDEKQTAAIKDPDGRTVELHQS